MALVSESAYGPLGDARMFDEGKSPQELLQNLSFVSWQGEEAAAQNDYALQIVPLLSHWDPEVVTGALETLGSLGKQGAWFVDDVAAHLSSNSNAVRCAAITALGHFGDASLSRVQDLTRCMSDSVLAVRASAVMALGRLRVEESKDAIVALLNGQSSIIAAAACQSIGLMGTTEADLECVATKMDEDATRFAAITALGHLADTVSASSLSKYVPNIINKCITDGASATRDAAVATLGKITPKVDEQSKEALVKLLDHEHAGVRCSAALALGRLGHAAAASAIARLLDDVTEDDSELHLRLGGVARSPAASRKPRCAALLALGLLGSDSYIRDCAKCTGDDNHEVRMCALDCLSNFPSAAGNHSVEIGSCLEDRVYLVRVKACQCIGRLGAEGLMENLSDVFEDKSPSVRVAALEALAVSPRTAENFMNEAVKCFSDPHPQVKIAVVNLFGALGKAAQSYASLIARMLQEEDVGVRGAACQALGRLGEYGEAFKDEISDCLGSESTWLCDAAALALKQMGQSPAAMLDYAAAGETE